MSINDIFHKIRPRQPSYRGLIQVYVRDGQIITAKWPKKRGKSKNPKVLEAQEWFRQAQWVSKYWPAQMQAQCAEAVKGTPLMPRDLMTMIMAGRAWYWVSEQGWKVFSMAAVKDVSDSLDVISQVPGSMLWRGPSLWTRIEPGALGTVLTSTGADTPPQWGAPPGGGGSPMIPYTDADININSANAAAPAILLVPVQAQSDAPVTGLVYPARVTLAGLNMRPVIYGGADAFAGPAVPTGQPLLADGPMVPITAPNILYRCALNSVFTPVIGRTYYVGFIATGATGNFNLAATGAPKRQWFNIGSYPVAPSVLPAMSAGSNNNTTWWSY